jgi:ribosomal protein S18 acetylase RimI-like enzyme
MMNAAIEVRRLTARDASHMQAIVAMLPEPEWRTARIPAVEHLARALADPAVYVFAAFDGERPAGFVSAYRFPSLTKTCELAYIYDVYVAPAAQERGVGRRLLDSMIAQCRKDGVAEAWVATDLDNEAARRLYVSAGARAPDEAYLQFEFDLAAPGDKDKPS